jgi:nitroreductase
VDLETVDELLTTTRAVRKRLDLTLPVPPEVITECVRLALQAPTAADSQLWRWVAVTDEARRKAIADLHRARDEAFVRGLLDQAEGAEHRRLESALYLLEHLHEVPVLMLVYAMEPPGPFPPAAI